MLAPVRTVYSRVEDREAWNQPKRPRPRKKNKQKESASPVPDPDKDGEHIDITA